MNDKQQLAAIGERMAEQPLCMAKRIEELEAQVRVMAGLLREAVAWMDDHPAMPDSSMMHDALAGKLPERPDAEWTDGDNQAGSPASSSQFMNIVHAWTAGDYAKPTLGEHRELQAQHDQLQSKYKAALDALSGAVEAAVAEGRSYRPWRYQAEELLGLHQWPIHYMRDNHTFKRLSDDVETAIEEIVTELDAGFTSGMLCSKRPGFVNIGTNYRQPREEFLSACREALLAAAPKPEAK